MNNNSKIVFSTKQFSVRPSLYNIIDIPSNCFTAKLKLRKIYKYFSNNKYKKGYAFIDKLSNTDDTKYFKIPKEDIKYIKKIIRLRYILKKMVFKWRCNIKKKDEKIINDRTLNFEPLDSFNNDELIKIYNKNTNTSHIFYYKNLINTIRMCLENSDYGICKPKRLNNPYTNEKLTLEQEISIFEQIKNISLKNKEILPTMLILYKKYYNVKKFKLSHYKYLGKIAGSNYVKDLDDELFDKVLSDFIHDFYRDKVCFKCIENIKNYRTIFEPIIINYINYSNRVTDRCKFISMTDSIITNYKIPDIYSKKHNSIHRKKIVAYPRLTQRQRYNFSANRIHNENLLRDQRIIHHLSNLENEILRRRHERRNIRNNNQDIIRSITPQPQPPLPEYVPPPEYETPPPLPENLSDTSSSDTIVQSESYIDIISDSNDPEDNNHTEIAENNQEDSNEQALNALSNNLDISQNIVNQYLDTIALINIIEDQMAEDE